MLVFGPYWAIPKNEDFTVFNLSSLTEAVPRLPGLFMVPEHLNNPAIMGNQDVYEKEFDKWYYDYVIEDPVACSSLMAIVMALYQGQKVYICISDYSSSDVCSTLNESFMKLIQTRYDIKYSVINCPEDYDYIPKDGCDFMSVTGIMQFDQDRKVFMQLIEEQRLANGGNYDFG